MKILDKYLNKEYLHLYLIFTLFFMGIFLLTDFFSSIRNLKKEADLFSLILYYLLQMPYLFILLSPFAVILSTLFVIVYLQSTRQIQAMQISGISIKRAILPLLATGVIISFSILFLDNTLIFQTNRMAQELQSKNFFPEALTEKIEKNIFIAVPPDYLFYIRSFNTEQNTMEDVLIYQKNLPSSLVLCRKAKWNGNQWVLLEGKEYSLGAKPQLNLFKEKKIPVYQEPSYFVRKYLPPEKMNLSTLQKHITEYKKAGFATRALQTEFTFKLAYPWANFILMFVGLSLGLFLKNRSRGASLGAGLMVSFGYYELSALFKTLGKSGVISPFLSPWIPNLIFLAGAIYLITRIE